MGRNIRSRINVRKTSIPNMASSFHELHSQFKKNGNKVNAVPAPSFIGIFADSQITVWGIDLIILSLMGKISYA